MLGKLLESSLAFTASNTIVCDTVEPLSAFDGERYMGVWYQIQHSKDFHSGVPGAQCTAANYSDLSDDAVFAVYNSCQVNYGERDGVHGTGRVVGDGEVIVNFYGPEPTEPNYLVMDTDYDNYTMVYACETADVSA